MRSEATGIRKRDAEVLEDKEDAENPTKTARRLRDDKPPVVDASADMTWRGDPENTFSDWTIEIVTTEEGAASGKLEDDEEDSKSGGRVNRNETIVAEQEDRKEKEVEASNGYEETGMKSVIQTYHVHRFVLACGSRKSDYFERVFRNGAKFLEGQTRTSRIELDSLAASVFPQLLDYLYQADKPLEITVETATALHHLGEYFEVNQLRWDAKQFCKAAISVQNVAIFHKHSLMFHDLSIHDSVVEFVSGHITEFSYDSDITKTFDKDLWLEVLDRIDPEDRKVCEAASGVICDFVCSHSQTKDLDLAAFHDLTEMKALPVLDYRASLLLCIIEDELEVDSGKEEDLRNNDNILSPIEERAATALANHYGSVLHWTETDHETLQELQGRSPAFLVDLLVKSWKKAQTDLRAEKKRWQSMLQNFKPVLSFSPAVAPTQVIGVPAPEALMEANPSLNFVASVSYDPDTLVVGATTGMPLFFYDTRSGEAEHPQAARLV
jgi:BTB/POZ domain